MTKRKFRLPRLVRSFGVLRRLQREEDGVTAVEFGLLALPFFAMVCATMETSLVFMARSVFETALHDAARVVRTGEASENGYTLADFRTKMCDHTYGLFDCDAIKIKVKIITSFDGVTFEDPVDEDTGEWVMTEDFSAGARKSIMVAEAYYKWDTIFDIMDFNLASLSSGQLVMAAAEVFQNEPF